jgi:hypothetical protein
MSVEKDSIMDRRRGIKFILLGIAFFLIFIVAYFLLPNIMGSKEVIVGYQGGEPEATIFISSNPTGASLFIDGRYIGETPNKLTTRIMGDHNITLELLGYKDWKNTISVDPYTDVSINPTLPPESFQISHLLQNTNQTAGIASLIAAIASLISTFFGIYLYFTKEKKESTR